jgi:prevent-host-death family protein
MGVMEPCPEIGRICIPPLGSFGVNPIGSMSIMQEATMARTVTAARAKSELAECIRKAESGEAVIITRHGKPVAVLVAAERMASIAGGRGRRGGGLAALAGGWKGSEDFVRTLAKLRRSAVRRIVRLDS